MIRDDKMNIDIKKLVDYTNFLEAHCKQIELLCKALESDMAFAVLCMDELNGKPTAKRLQDNIEQLRSNLPVGTDVYERLLEIRRQAEKLLGQEGGN